MYKVLTTDLIDILIRCGYTHFLSRTTALQDDTAGIIFTPVNKVPMHAEFPQKHETVYQISTAITPDNLTDSIVLVDLTNITCYKRPWF